MAWGYCVVWGIIVLVAVIMVILFKKKDGYKNKGWKFIIFIEQKGDDTIETKNYYHFNPDCFSYCHPHPEYPSCGSTDIFLENCHVSDYHDYFFSNPGICYWLFRSKITEEIELPAY
jgi:hypothetical protein